MQEVKFTIDQLNHILNQLSEMPYKYSAGLVQMIQQIAAEQLRAEVPPAPQEAPADAAPAE